MLHLSFVGCGQELRAGGTDDTHGKLDYNRWGRAICEWEAGQGDYDGADPVFLEHGSGRDGAGSDLWDVHGNKIRHVAKWNKHLLDKVPDFNERGSGVQHRRREAARWQHLTKAERRDEVHTTHLLDRVVRKARGMLLPHFFLLLPASSYAFQRSLIGWHSSLFLPLLQVLPLPLDGRRLVQDVPLHARVLRLALFDE